MAKENDVQFPLYITKEEKAELKEVAQLAGTNMTRILRDGAMQRCKYLRMLHEQDTCN